MSMVMAVTMMPAGGIFAQLALEVPFDGLLHGAFSAGGGLNPEILEVVDCTPPHAAGNDHIGAVPFDESWYLSVAVPTGEGVWQNLNRFHFLPFKVNQGKKGSSSKMLGHLALKAIFTFYCYCYSHFYLLVL
jgi:hypothetical protein